MRYWPRSVALGLLLVAALPVGGEGAGSVNIPINDPRTELVERVALSGLVYTALLGTRPYSRMEAARSVAEALRNLDRLQRRVRRGSSGIPGCRGSC